MNTLNLIENIKSTLFFKTNGDYDFMLDTKFTTLIVDLGDWWMSVKHYSWSYTRRVESNMGLECLDRWNQMFSL